MNCRLVEGDELKFPHKNARHYPEICEDWHIGKSHMAGLLRSSV
jgi:hypothetical protein